jgi:3-oxoacyl-[acyl-carrier-protein] synthase II
MKAYIRSTSCISPQKTFDDAFLTEIVEYSGTRLPAIEPDYKQFIDTKQARRMSHVIKMGVAAAKKCLANAAVVQPGAIITGTALGCIEDTIVFLTRMVEQQEEMLPPTAFIQSTHNTVAAQVALMLQCHNYNFTYVHKGISFESALLDGLMLLNEKEAENVLVGAIEEMVDASFKVLTRLGQYKRHPVSNLRLFEERSKGTIGGEGAAFFLLNHQPAAENLAELTALKVLFKPANVESSIAAFLNANELGTADIDLVLTGHNGDTRNDEPYESLAVGLFKNNVIATYKQLCGEYPVASSFALWLAANILKHQKVPGILIKKDLRSFENFVSPGDTPLRKILIYNHYQHIYHSLMLVSAV